MDNGTTPYAPNRMGAPFSSMNSSYFLIILDHAGQPRVTAVPDRGLTVGRVGYGSQLELNSGIVSKNHGFFAMQYGNLSYTDLGTNANGTYCNGQMIHTVGQNTTVTLKEGDILRIDSSDLSHPHSSGVIMIVTTIDLRSEHWVTVPLSAFSGDIIIGREPGNGRLVVPRINVSRRHARITRGAGGQLFIEDLGSLNHTLVNGMMINGRVPLRERDVINICSTRIIYTSGTFTYNLPAGAAGGFAPRQGAGAPRPGYQPHSYPMGGAGINRRSISFAPQQGNTITLRGLRRMVKDSSAPGGEKCILDLSQNEVTIRPGELVAVIGGSGAGKTTLVNCMNAFEPATYGDVFINGVSLYQNREAFRLQIGYVPQQDIVHDLLSVHEMLTFVARLRLPRGLSRAELDHQVMNTLKAVGLDQHRNTIIRRLSGGQRKRASIAVEMIADPTLFFLDEPTSGLDPEMEQQLTSQLRDYAHNGRKTVIVVTHTLQSIELYDKIIFLAPTVNGSGGRLAFFGGAEEARQYFEVDDMVEAYKKVTANPAHYAAKYLDYCRRGGMR